MHMCVWWKPSVSECPWTKSLTKMSKEEQNHCVYFVFCIKPLYYINNFCSCYATTSQHPCQQKISYLFLKNIWNLKLCKLFMGVLLYLLWQSHFLFCSFLDVLRLEVIGCATMKLCLECTWSGLLNQLSVSKEKAE